MRRGDRSHPWLGKPQIMWLQSNGRLVVTTGGSPAKPGQTIWSSGLPKNYARLMAHGGRFVAERLADGSIEITLVNRSDGKPDVVVKRIHSSRIRFRRWPFMSEKDAATVPSKREYQGLKELWRGVRALAFPPLPFWQGVNGVRRHLMRVLTGPGQLRIGQ